RNSRPRVSLVKPVCSAASLLAVSRWLIVSIDVGENGRAVFATSLRRSARASSADWASRAPASARLGAHLVGLVAERVGEQAQQGAPALERLAHLMHGLGVGEFGVGEGPAGIG